MTDKVIDEKMERKVITFEEAKKNAEEVVEKHMKAMKEYAEKEARESAMFNSDMKYTIEVDKCTPAHTSFRLFVNGAFVGALTLRNDEFEDFENRLSEW